MVLENWGRIGEMGGGAGLNLVGGFLGGCLVHIPGRGRAAGADTFRGGG